MANRIERIYRNADSAFRVGDCYIWAEIQYLDSSTDYREHLPEAHSKVTPATKDELVMLDSGSVSWAATIVLLSVFLAGVAGLACEIYLAVSGP